MLTSSSSGISPAAASKLYYQPVERAVRPQETAHSHNYDSFTLSSATGEEKLQREFVSRLSNEIRTATTTGDIQAYRAQVASGSYQVDPQAIAARILWLEG